MKYHNLYIDFEKSWETYHAISEILSLIPVTDRPTWFSSETPGLWTYQVITHDQDPYFDFINVFLNHLEPHWDELANLRIQKTNILFWLVYEYDEQCSLEFHPSEMKRLGESGIVLNIDCHKSKKK